MTLNSLYCILSHSFKNNLIMNLVGSEWEGEGLPKGWGRDVGVIMIFVVLCLFHFFLAIWNTGTLLLNEWAS